MAAFEDPPPILVAEGSASEALVVTRPRLTVDRFREVDDELMVLELTDDDVLIATVVEVPLMTVATLPGPTGPMLQE